MTANEVQTLIGKDQFNIDIRMFSAKYIKDDIYTVGDNDEPFLQIKPDYWSSINIKNDMFELLPSLVLDVADQGIQYITPYIGDGNAFVRIKIYDVNKKITIDETFVVDDVRLTSLSNSSAIYTIYGSSVRKVWFGQSIAYSTGYDTPLEVSNIIEDILEVAKIDFYEIEKYFKVSKGKIPYISPANSNVYDNLSYLFKRILIEDSEDGIYTLPYDMIKQKLIFTKIKDKMLSYSEADAIKKQNVLQLSTKDEASSDKETNILEPETIMNIGGSTLSYDLSSDVDINVFDHKARTWTVDPKSYDTITKLMPDLITDYADNTVEETIMKPLADYFINEGIKYKNSVHTWYHPEYADNVQKLFKLTDSLYFQCQGHFDRMPTDLFEVSTAKSNLSLANRYSGLWMIARVTTKLSKKAFYQDIDLIRVNKKESGL